MSREHLALPLKFLGKRFATVDDGSLEEITQNVRVIVGTRPGERIVIPDFGVEDPTFQRIDQPFEDLQSTVDEWEDRATVEVETTISTRDGSSDTRIYVSMRETD